MTTMFRLVPAAVHAGADPPGGESGSIARYYDVTPWSEEHWTLLPPYLEMLAGAGQKCITASILHRPWGGQTYDHFESKIDWIYLGNDRWELDYSVFDRWGGMPLPGVTTAICAGLTIHGWRIL